MFVGATGGATGASPQVFGYACYPTVLPGSAAHSAAHSAGAASGGRITLGGPNPQLTLTLTLTLTTLA